MEMLAFILYVTLSATNVLAYDHNSQYITYTEGNCSLIFSVPHGGYETPSSLADRTVCSSSYRGCYLTASNTCDYSHDASYNDAFCGCTNCKVSYLRDHKTKEIALGVEAQMKAISGCAPYMIINELKRNKMDANREIDIATFGDPDAEEAWETYHERIAAAKSSIGKEALLIDFHGNSHEMGWTEFGYTVSKSDLNKDPEDPDDPFDPEDASICNLVKSKCGGGYSTCFEDILRGDKSLGYFLQLEQDAIGANNKTVPSPGYTKPDAHGYYSGGYITKQHGSKNCDVNEEVDAIQIEMPNAERWEDVLRGPYINSIARAIKKFMEAHYNNWV